MSRLQTVVEKPKEARLDCWLGDVDVENPPPPPGCEKQSGYPYDASCHSRNQSWI